MKPRSITEEALKKIDLSRYTMELKYDGWRIILVNNGLIQCFTRDHKPINVPLELMEEIEKLDIPIGSALDGEIWNPEKRAAWTNIEFWDIMKLGSKHLGELPIETRREVLHEIIPATGNVKRVQVVEPSIEMIQSIEKLAFENRNKNKLESGFIHGVVLKRKRSKRHDTANRSQEHGDWLKYVFKGMTGYEPRS